MGIYKLTIEYVGGYGSDKYFYGNKGLDSAQHDFCRARKDQTVVSAKIAICEANYRGELDAIHIYWQFKRRRYMVPAELE